MEVLLVVAVILGLGVFAVWGLAALFLTDSESDDVTAAAEPPHGKKDANLVKDRYDSRRVPNSTHTVFRDNSTTSSDSSNVPDVESDSRKQNEKSKLNWPTRIALGIAILAFLNYPPVDKYIDTFISEIVASYDFSEYKCSDLAKRWRGESLHNVFGASIEIILIRDINEISRSKVQLSCGARVTLSNGNVQSMIMQIKKDNHDILYQIR